MGSKNTPGMVAHMGKLGAEGTPPASLCPNGAQDRMCRVASEATTRNPQGGNRYRDYGLDGCARLREPVAGQ